MESSNLHKKNIKSIAAVSAILPVLEMTNQKDLRSMEQQLYEEKPAAKDDCQLHQLATAGLTTTRIN
jgi:hypothetical protein